ncbi:TetR/AcrR family transcriptional regulator [Nocardioides sp. GXQ0305]|uniref:TetR/AcrR family transcriptional regulator n=1 Tax=Nocardioides sp. GXQ0305 TaxID=3423912 RepID=UPI003D7E0C24
MTVKTPIGHRQRQAEETKAQVARTARRLFAERGYLATTVAAISEEAGIPEQTIYSALGSKARILERITAQWMVDADTATLAERSHEAPEAADRVRLLATINRRQLEVGWDVIGIYQEAGRADAGMARTLRRVLAAREGEVRRLLLTVKDDLAPGVTVRRALDVTLALMNIEAYRLLVNERGWTPARYESWLGDLLVSQLLR